MAKSKIDDAHWPEDGRRRVVIEGVAPEVDAGAFPVKRAVGERVIVEADAFTDGHDAVASVLRYRHEPDGEWREVVMTALGNDRWQAAFVTAETGFYRYTVSAWIDHFESWRRDLRKRIEAGQDEDLHYRVGAGLLAATAQRAAGVDAGRLTAAAHDLESVGEPGAKRARALDPQLAQLMRRHDARAHAAHYDRELRVRVDRERARFGAWYEFFPRSTGAGGRHGSFADAAARLDDIAAMGFDVVYLPPIHPIGREFRKGRNNALTAAADDVGSPWAIGAREGGHKSVHPELGTLEDFRRFRRRAEELGMEVALDIAFQCAPDHPYVAEHPEWFRRRPDGSIQYAENPPKKYQDILPFDFETEGWRELWAELIDVVRFWASEGVRVFRVDNPHTKPFALWQTLIAAIQADHPETIFLAEAFTRPKVMHRLAKLGFSQSYTYFTWRNSKQELTEYFIELAQSRAREYFRPNVWPNTPDILHAYLQYGGRPAFAIRLTLAATLAASYGVYGPAFELLEDRPREAGSEAYRDSEKYQLRDWDLTRADSLADLMTRLNRIRRENPALHGDWSLCFHRIDNEYLLCYSKRSPDLSNIIVTVVNLDPHHTQSGWVELPLADFGLDDGQPYQVHDLLSGGHYIWYGPHNFVEIDPHSLPGHVFRLRRRLRSEHDFDYYL
ncbi:MAG TPA: alpha-1,4-glucan--maltose-1-phosphate maltosyltransferase [Acidiferrobacterales bacterium]